jgi:hypothetical protein
MDHFTTSPPQQFAGYGNQHTTSFASGMITPPNRPNHIFIRTAASAPTQRVADINDWASIAGKRSVPIEPESPNKRVKTVHTAFSGAFFTGNRTSQPANTASAQGLVTTPAASSAQQSASARADTKDQDDSSAPAKVKAKVKREIKVIDADSTIVPPKSFEINTDEQKPYGVEADEYLTSDKYWLTPQELIKEFGGDKSIIKPEPKGGDVGIPTTAAEIEALAKQVYDAIIDFRYLFGTRKAPTAALLLGDVNKALIVKRSYDLVNETIDFHKNGVSANVFCNSHNLTANATKLEQLKRTNEQNDTFKERMDNIIVALRHHKTICMDVITDKVTMKYAVILAPRAKLTSKFNYAKSNHERGEQAKVLKRKAAELDELKKEKDATGA